MRQRSFVSVIRSFFAPTKYGRWGIWCGLADCKKEKIFLMGLRAKFSRRFCNQCRSADWRCCTRLVESLHGSLHLLVDPITRGCGEKATVGVSQ